VRGQIGLLARHLGVQLLRRFHEEEDGEAHRDADERGKVVATSPAVLGLHVDGEGGAQDAADKWTCSEIAENAVALAVRDPGAKAFVDRCPAQ